LLARSNAAAEQRDKADQQHQSNCCPKAFSAISVSTRIEDKVGEDHYQSERWDREVEKATPALLQTPFWMTIANMIGR
jgi:hypothetical protein